MYTRNVQGMSECVDIVKIPAGIQKALLFFLGIFRKRFFSANQYYSDHEIFLFILSVFPMVKLKKYIYIFSQLFFITFF